MTNLGLSEELLKKQTIALITITNSSTEMSEKRSAVRFLVDAFQLT